MQKIHTENGIEFKYTAKDIIRLSAIGLAFVVGAFSITYAGFSLLVDKQMEYGYAEEDYKKATTGIFEAREALLNAEKELAKEKLNIATGSEDWNEVERLTEKVKEIDMILNDKENWVVFQ